MSEDLPGSQVWTYRYGTVDGPSRFGSFERDSVRLPLPLVIDGSGWDDGSPILHFLGPSLEWKEFEALIVEDDGKVPEVIQEHLIMVLKRIGIEPLSAAVSKRLYMVEAGGSKLEMEVLPHFALLSTDPLKAVKALCAFRDKEIAHAPLFIPGMADSGNLEFLLYAGVEVTDTIAFRSDAAKGLYTTRGASLPFNSLGKDMEPGDLCGCDACRKMTGSKDPDPILLGEHNISMMLSRVKEAVHHFNGGNLRNLVMSRLSGNPQWMAALRVLEGGALTSLSGKTPTYRKIGRVEVTYRDDLHAPDFSLWRRRIREDYMPRGRRPVLLLLPCSARKPYSTSRTHQRIVSALQSVKGWRNAVHRVVLTSPLGVVPMELEDLYPASSYDIPVTGEWHLEEISMIREMTENLMGKASPEVVVSFHPEGSIFFRDGEKNLLDDLIDIHSIAAVSGKDPHIVLREQLASIVDSLGSELPSSDRQDTSCMLDMALGCSSEEVQGLYYRTTRRGRVLLKGKKEMFHLNKGGPVPTITGGELLWELGEEKRGRTVLIDDFTPRGTVFGQGIKELKGRINPGDIVLVGHDSEFRGVGRALVDSGTMGSNRAGPAVKMLSHVSGHH
ncbi:MAG: DUF5591 domain-containing protein [Thermoplasmatota archaeon]